MADDRGGRAGVHRLCSRAGNRDVRRVPYEAALKAATTHAHDFLTPYVTRARLGADTGAIRLDITLVARLRMDHSAILEKRREFQPNARRSKECRGQAVINEFGGNFQAVSKLWQLLDAHETQSIRQCLVCRLPK